MTARNHDIFNGFAALLGYPDAAYADAAGVLGRALTAMYPDATADWRSFEEFVHVRDVHELEEHFTRTFEINPQCALEFGWHLFGEEYLRGQFLVRLRGELRRFAIPESTELPDHATHVLAILSAMPHDEAAVFAAACVLPALDKMLEAFADKRNPFEHVLRCLRLVLCREFDLPEESSLAGEDDDSTGAADPLWRYPVRLESAGAPVQFVPLELRYGAVPAATGDVAKGGLS